jgi:hypothetical protein
MRQTPITEEQMAFSALVKGLLENAREDGHVCMLGTAGPDGPNISPKGSLVVYDDEHLAYWERSHRSARKNLEHDPRVIICYSNQQAQTDGVLESGILRFYGTATLHEMGTDVADRIFSLLNQREQTHDGADEGVGVLIKVEHAADVRGKPIP